jgi:hypothetical protein
VVVVVVVVTQVPVHQAIVEERMVEVLADL